jgi:hypothetical protein
LQASPSRASNPQRLPVSILTAYPYMTAGMFARLLAAGEEVRWLLDSGAFTAWKSGKPIALDDYCRFLDCLPIQPFGYFMLDVIRDAEATLRNYETMLTRGFKPIPVITYGQSLDVLDEFYKHTPLVAFGGISDPRSRSATSSTLRIERVMRAAKGRPIHLLGYTVFDDLKRFRPYSCDSTTWVNGQKYGEMIVYVGMGRVKRLRRHHFKKRPDDELIAHLRNFGVEPTELQRETAWRGGKCVTQRVTALSWIAYMMDIERNIGTRVFLACSSTTAFDDAVRAYREAQSLPWLRDKVHGRRVG